MRRVLRNEGINLVAAGGLTGSERRVRSKAQGSHGAVCTAAGPSKAIVARVGSVVCEQRLAGQRHKPLQLAGRLQIKCCHASDGY